MTPRAVAVPVVRRAGVALERTQDLVAAEAPILVRLRRAGDARDHRFGLVMRTPGDDEDLVIGLVASEGLIRTIGDVLDVTSHAAPAGDDAGTDEIIVTVAPAIDLEAAIATRATAVSSACGLCGRAKWLRLAHWAPPAPDQAWSIEMLASLPDRLRDRQPVFAETGGLHAAGLFDGTGTALVVREDIGRHNAVDKVIGAAWRARLEPAPARLLAVSGRAAYEIVQKAAVAGVAGLVAVGAPSSLAVAAAREAGLLLAGFARDGGCNVYAGHRHVR